MKKTYISPEIEGVKFCGMLMSASAPTAIHPSEDDAVETGDVLSKGYGSSYWED